MWGHPGQGEAVESVRIPRVLFKKGSTQLFTAEIVKGGLVAILILDEDNDNYVIMVPKGLSCLRLNKGFAHFLSTVECAMKLRVGYKILFLPPYFQVVVNLQQKVMPSHPRKLSGLKSQEG